MKRTSRLIGIVFLIIPIALLVLSCDFEDIFGNNSDESDEIAEETIQMNIDGNLDLDVSFIPPPWEAVVSKISTLQNINSVTVYVYNSSGDEIFSEELEIVDGRAKGSIELDPEENLTVTLVFAESDTIQWIGEDEDVDVKAGETAHVTITAHYMGSRFTSPDTVKTGTDVNLRWHKRQFALEYQVQEWAPGDSSSWQNAYNGPDSSKVIRGQGRQKGTYKYRIRVKTKYGWGPWFIATLTYSDTGTIDIDVPIPGDVDENYKILFTSSRDGDEEIYSLNPDGTNLVKLTDNEHGDYHASWSPDRSTIAYVEFGRKVGDGEISIMDSNGEKISELTNDTVFDDYPVFSPDGTSIVFSKWLNSFPQTCIMTSSGIFVTCLTDSSTHNYALSWVDSRISYMTYDIDSISPNYEVFVMNDDGSNSVRLSDNSIFDADPVFSPDGSKIAFTSQRDGDSNIYIMDADGSNVVQITYDTARDRYPSFSPDGTMLVFDSNRNGNDDIFVINIDGTGLTQLTDHPANDYYARW